MKDTTTPATHAAALTAAQSLAATLASVPTVSQAIANYVNKAGKCSWKELYAVFGHAEDTESHRKQFSLLLVSLVKRGQINACHRCGVGRKIADRYYTSIEDNPTVISTNITPPPQNNTMTAPVWVPPVCSALRPGALDYKRYASHGHQC